MWKRWHEAYDPLMDSKPVPTSPACCPALRFADVVQADPARLGGTPVFRGTRVPIQNLFDYLQGGHSVDVFLDHFPGVSREQVLVVLEHAAADVRRDAQAA